ncbi:MAG: NAD(+) synthase, partial [Planctomycetota bacterium]
FEEDVLVVDLRGEDKNSVYPSMTEEEEIWHALVLGTKDYVHKCGFQKVVLGLSGGVDSSLVAAIAKEAVGPENVLGVMMPSPYSSRSSIEDAKKLVENLGIRSACLPISDIMMSYEKTLKDIFSGQPKDVTEENIQARIRGNLLMSIANKFGYLLLTTGNKSEMAVGYCTLYGDMSGGLAVISDVPKTMVYRICRWLNKEKEIIPENVLIKPPSAELRPDQKDEDSLPPYEVLDQVLRLYIEERKSLEEIVESGVERETAVSIINLVHRAEFKRKQAPPGIKVTDRAFGTGWRMPIAAKVWDVG